MSRVTTGPHMATHLSSGGQLTHEGCYQRCRQARPCQSQNNSGLNEVDGYLRLRVFIQALRQFQIQELQHFPLSVGCVTDGVHPWSSRISPRGPVRIGLPAYNPHSQPELLRRKEEFMQTCRAGRPGCIAAERGGRMRSHRTSLRARHVRACIVGARGELSKR